MIRDPYAVLGLAPDADFAAVKLAYRRLAKACHPDVAPGDPAAEQRFHEIRRAYDAINRRLVRAVVARPRSRDEIVMEERARVRVKAPRRGQDRAARLDVTLEEIALGAEKRVELAPGVAVIAKIPAGAEPGAMLRFTGLGQPGRNGGPPGDGLVTLRVKPHSRFRLNGADVHMKVEISARRLAAGGFVRVPTLTGDVQMRIPKDITPGAMLRIKGRGLPARGKRLAGDFYVTLQVVSQDTEATAAA